MQLDPAYSVGLNEIDAQHWHFFALLDAMELAVKLQDAARVHALLDEVRRYAYAHFKSEEAYMDAYRYAGEHHRSEHRRLMERLEKTVTDPELRIASIRLFLYNWLVDHIQLEDMQLANHILSIRSAILPVAQEPEPDTRRECSR